jgi:mediator of RNA polymerase II transcription subunit 14
VSAVVFITECLVVSYQMSSARVAYTKVERQLKLRGIEYTHISLLRGGRSPFALDLTCIQSSLAHSVPTLCVLALHILSGAPAAEAAMSNICVIRKLGRLAVG